MPFTVKDWKDAPHTGTPISATALEDLETRVTDYTDDEIAALVAAQLPWTIDINPFGVPATQTNWSTLTVAAAQLCNGYLVSTGAQNAEIGWDVILAAGTWTIELLSAKGSNQGIVTAKLDGVSKGTMDSYAVSGQNNVKLSVTGITVATTGKKRLLLRMETKNASASAYAGYLSAVRLLRTA